MNHNFLVLQHSQMTQAQLDTLQTENQHLKSLLQRKESHSPKVCLLWHSYSVFTDSIRQNSFLNLALTQIWLISLFFLLSESHLRGWIPHLLPWGRVMCHLWAAWSRRIVSWGRNLLRSTRNLGIKTNMSKLCSVTPRNLLRTGTWQTHTDTQLQHQEIKPWCNSCFIL